MPKPALGLLLAPRLDHTSLIDPLNAHARHLLSLLENPEVSVDRVAAAIAVGVDRHAPPEFEPLQEIDALAALAGASVPGPTEAMAHVFGSLGFAPNVSNYYALSNSLLHRVLETRRGNPISLAVVAIEISKRLGVKLVPVGMPGHFLIGYSSDPSSAPDRWFDPFGGGKELSAENARQIFDAVTPASVEFRPMMLGQTPTPFVASRIIANIKNAAIRSGDIPAFIGAHEMALGVPGAGLNDHKALVRSLATSGRHDRAAEIFQWLAEHDPQNADGHWAAYAVQTAHRN